MPNLIFIAAAGLGAWWLLGRGALASRSKILFRRLKVIGRGLSLQFELTFAIQNPTNQTSTISAVTGEVYVNNKLIADFSSFQEQKVNPKSQSEFKVVATPSGGIIQLLSSKGWLKPGVAYIVKGTMNADGLLIPFEYRTRLF